MHIPYWFRLHAARLIYIEAAVGIVIILLLLISKGIIAAREVESFADSWAAIIVAAAAIAAVFVTIYHERKSTQLKGLQFIYERLHDVEERAARGRILRAYYTYLKTNGKDTTYTHTDFLEKHPCEIDIADFNPAIRADVERVKNTFEHIAVMVKHGLVNEEAYFDAYWGSMLRCYGALDGHIRKMQDRSGTKWFTVYYPEQCKRAVEYWSKNHKDSTIRYYSDYVSLDDFENSA